MALDYRDAHLCGNNTQYLNVKSRFMERAVGHEGIRQCTKKYDTEEAHLLQLQVTAAGFSLVFSPSSLARSLGHSPMHVVTECNLRSLYKWRV